MTKGRGFKLLIALVFFGSLATAEVFPPAEGDLAVSIPFAFQVAGQTMQPGEYIIHRDFEQGVLEVCEDGVYCALITEARLVVSGNGQAPQLVFVRTSGDYVLSFVQCDGSESYELPDCQRYRDCPTRRVQARKLIIFAAAGLSASWR